MSKVYLIKYATYILAKNDLQKISSLKFKKMECNSVVSLCVMSESIVWSVSIYIESLQDESTTATDKKVSLMLNWKLISK